MSAESDSYWRRVKRLEPQMPADLKLKLAKYRVINNRMHLLGRWFFSASLILFVVHVFLVLDGGGEVENLWWTCALLVITSLSQWMANVLFFQRWESSYLTWRESKPNKKSEYALQNLRSHHGTEE